MLKGFEDFFTENKITTKGKRFLVAVSGGVDSVVVTELFFRKGYNFGIAHCNFMLRDNESDGDEKFVKNLANSLNVPYYSNNFDTLSFSAEKKISIQMAARELRYNWFNEIASNENFDHIVIAHNLDDQIETFLINITRGTGISGLRGIKPVNGKIIRPLLFTQRKEIEDFAKKNNLEFRHDSSNDTDKYLRNNIRHNVVPALKEASSNFYTAFVDTLLNISSTEKIYSAEIDSKKRKLVKAQGDDFIVDIRKLESLNYPEIYLYEILSEFGFNFSTVRNIIRSLPGQSGKTFFSSSHRLIKDRDSLIVTLLKEKGSEVFQINENDNFIDHPVKLIISTDNNTCDFSIPKDVNIAVFDKSKLKFPLLIRKYQKGDFFVPFGMKGRKKISDYFTGEKFSISKKENVWLICSGEDIIWIVGHRTDERYKINNKTINILRISLIE